MSERGDPVETAAPERDVLRKLAEAATPGPWGWRGHDDGCVELVTLHSGQLRVVSAMRSEPCIVTLDDEDVALTFEACDDCKAKWAEAAEADDSTPVWEGYRCTKERNLGTVWLWDRHGFVLPANAWAVRERSYRSDVAEVDHPDARYLAAVSPDVVLALIDEIDRLNALLPPEGEGWRVVRTDLPCGDPKASHDYSDPHPTLGRCVIDEWLPTCPGDPDLEPKP